MMLKKKKKTTKMTLIYMKTMIKMLICQIYFWQIVNLYYTCVLMTGFAAIRLPVTLTSFMCWLFGYAHSWCVYNKTRTAYRCIWYLLTCIWYRCEIWWIICFGADHEATGPGVDDVNSWTLQGDTVCQFLCYLNPTQTCLSWRILSTCTTLRI